MKLSLNKSNLTDSAGHSDNCRSLQQYDWLKLVVAWLKPELGNCNFLLRNKLNNYVRGGEGRRG